MTSCAAGTGNRRAQDFAWLVDAKYSYLFPTLTIRYR
jgi:hypothetical protein